MVNIRYLILVLTNRCNLNCLYCYNGDIQSPMDMSEEVMARAFALARDGEGPLHLQLTGGEPSLVPHLIRMAIKMAGCIARPLSVAVQTNATCLTPELLSFFRNSEIEVGVSIDGPPAVHEALRGKSAMALKGLQLLEAMAVPFRVTTVVSRENVQSLDRLVLMVGGFSQARGIGLDLLVRKGRAAESAPPVMGADSRELGQGIEKMVKALSHINRRRSIPLELRELEIVLRQSQLMANRQSFCHACKGESVAVHPDGTLFPCGQTLGDPDLAAGTVWMPDPERLHLLKKIALSSEWEKSAEEGLPYISCDGCQLQGRCPGECPGRLYYNRGKAGEAACIMYRKLWESVRSEADLAECGKETECSRKSNRA